MEINVIVVVLLGKEVHRHECPSVEENKMKKKIEVKISRDESRKGSYQMYMLQSVPQLKNELVKLVTLKDDTELAIEALTDALFSKGDQN